MQKEFDKLYEQVVTAKAEWQNTFDSIPDLICIIDKNARIKRVNRSFSVRLRRHYETLIGAHCDEILNTPDRPPMSALFSTVLKTGDPAQGEHEVEIDGTVYATTLYPFYDAVGNLHGAVQILRDVTDQKRLKDKLIQTEKMAAIGTLAAEIAHDINNPLDYINNYLYLLSESLPPDFKKREYVDRIQAGIDNLTALTRDLLEFSRPPMDTFAPIEIDAILERALELTTEAVKSNSISVRKEFHCRDFPLLGSERMLLQVFVNLIQNAVDAMAPGGTLSLASSCVHDHCTLLVRDTGSGIPEKNISRIFEPFFTTKKTATKRGTGLGLAICYNIINRHHGEISVSSKEGEGTSFTVTLPVGYS